MKIFGEHLIDLKAINQFFSIVKGNEDIIDWALMPDAHYGQIVPIGSVILSKSIHPEWCGVDIGCGVLSYKFKSNNIELDWFYDEILKVGFNHREVEGKRVKLIHQIDNSDLQLGTLGGGNHFIELGKDLHNDYWLTIHSGSRGVGFKTAQYLQEQRPDNTFEILLNLEHWASVNRSIIAQEILKLLDNAQILDKIESIHNNVVKYKGGYLHRKGATDASKNIIGLIPASMGDGVYITRGKGNSLDSCSHGAGRVSSRREAKKNCDINAFAQQMQGIKCKLVKDENPNAYKDINEVLKAQEDNVEVINYIKPILNIKG